MIVNPIALGGAWEGDRPKEAWVLLLQEQHGRALNVEVKAGATFTGSINMAELLKSTPKGSFGWRKAANKNPTPTALSLLVDRDLYIGFMLSPAMGVEFAETPFTGGAIDVGKYWFEPTRNSATTAWLMARGSAFPEGDFVMPFNIHLVATGTFNDGTRYVTPLILDPDGRKPDGGGPGL